MTLSQERLKELVDYNPSTGEMIRKNSKKRTSAKAKSRSKINIDGEDYLVYRLAFLYMIGRWPNGQVDHINRNYQDNRWDNLRECSQVLNSCNQGVRKNNSSGYKGVHFFKALNKWQARIRVDGARKHLGYFETAEEAASAYDQAAKAHFPLEFVVLNMEV